MKGIALFSECVRPRDGLHHLPLFIDWYPGTGENLRALREAREWMAWAAAHPVRRLCFGWGSPEVDAWELYIEHLKDLARSLGLRYKELIKLRDHEIKKRVKDHCTHYLEIVSVNHPVVGQEYRVEHAYRRYREVFEAALRFRLVDDVPRFTCIEEVVA